METSNGQRAMSTVLSVSLLILIAISFAILLYNFVTGMVENVTETSSVQPFSLSIDNISINDTSMTVYIQNLRNNDATIDKVYVNNEPREVSFNSKVIPKGSTLKINISGYYTCGTLYEVKIVFTSGYTVLSMQRY